MFKLYSSVGKSVRDARAFKALGIIREVASASAWEIWICRVSSFSVALVVLRL